MPRLNPRVKEIGHEILNKLVEHRGGPSLRKSAGGAPDVEKMEVGDGESS